MKIEYEYEYIQLKNKNQIQIGIYSAQEKKTNTNTNIFGLKISAEYKYYFFLQMTDYVYANFWTWWGGEGVNQSDRGEKSNAASVILHLLRHSMPAAAEPATTHTQLSPLRHM